MSVKKEPPDKYRCLKLPISYILIKNKEEVKENIDILQNAILRANNITSKSYLHYWKDLQK
jgi:hypothetical protein